MHAAISVVIALITAAAVTFVAYRVLLALPNTLGVGRRNVRNRLATVSVQRHREEHDGLEETGPQSSGIILLLIQKIVLLKRLHDLAVKAGQSHNAERYVLLSPLIALTFFVLSGVFTQSLVVSLLAFLLGAASPAIVLSVLVSRRQEKLETQLPDALEFMARAMRAGHGLTVALGMLASEMPEPIGPEFRTVQEEVNFGIPFHEALRKVNDRVDSADLRFFVSAILIQRETGGNLAELLEGLSLTVRERLKLKGRVKILAAEGKVAGTILGVIPFLLGGGMALLNPEYMSVMWTTDSGKNLVLIACGLIFVGHLWMGRIAQVKV